MSEFNLPHLVAEVTATSEEVHPWKLTEEVFNRIPDVDRDDALKTALKSYIVGYISGTRQRLINEGDETTQVPRAGAQQRSRKVAGIREEWQRRMQAALASRVSVGHTEYKFYRDCTIEDLTFLINDRRQRAVTLAENAEVFERVRGTLVALNLTTVGQLPEEEVKKLGRIL